MATSQLRQSLMNRTIKQRNFPLGLFSTPKHFGELASRRQNKSVRGMVVAAKCRDLELVALELEERLVPYKTAIFPKKLSPKESGDPKIRTI